MMTVKWCSPDGFEQIFPVHDIKFIDRECTGQIGRSPASGHVWFNRPAFKSDVPVMEHVYDGTVYLMNEAGKTVAKYELGGWPLENSHVAKGAIIGGAITTDIRSQGANNLTNCL